MCIILCEQCGEEYAISHSGHASLCEDCFESSVRTAIEESGLGNFCCRLIRRANEQYAVCLEPYGIEHDHSSTDHVVEEEEDESESLPQGFNQPYS